MRMADCWLGWMGRGLAAVSLSGSLGLAPSAWAADEETKEVKVAPAAPVPGRDGFSLVADRLGSIPFAVHLVAGSAAVEPRVTLMRELLPETLAQVNAHIGRDRIGLAPATLAALGPEGWGKFCDEVLVAFAKGAYPGVLGQGDLNGLRHVTRGDRIDPATGAFTPGTTAEAVDAAPPDTGRWKPCDRCVIL